MSEDFYEPTRCCMCGTTDLWGQWEVIRSPMDFVYVVCSPCRGRRDPAWDANGFLLYPARVVIQPPVVWSDDRTPRVTL